MIVFAGHFATVNAGVPARPEAWQESTLDGLIHKGVASLLSINLRKTSDKLAEFMPPLA